MPTHWQATAAGDAKTCTQRWLDQLKAGAEGIAIHASTPEAFVSVVAKHENIRPDNLFTGRTH